MGNNTLTSLQFSAGRRRLCIFLCVNPTNVFFPAIPYKEPSIKERQEERGELEASVFGG